MDIKPFGVEIWINAYALTARSQHRAEKWNALFGTIRCLGKRIDRHFASDRTRGDQAKVSEFLARRRQAGALAP